MRLGAWLLKWLTLLHGYFKLFIVVTWSSVYFLLAVVTVIQFAIVKICDWLLYLVDDE